ncbi:MAG: hypothetical protein AAF938_30250 [Myxococcota bacterium]
MHLSSPSESGLTLTVNAGRPGLVIEYLGSGCLRVRRRSEALFWARVELRYEGVWVARRDRRESLGVVPPIRADEARSVDTIEGWMKFFARSLGESAASPLRPGVWQLTELREPADLTQQLRAGTFDVYAPVDRDRLPCMAYGMLKADASPPAGYVSWGINGSGDVCLLRSPSDPNASRVKSWRKHAREQTLPPILLWWVGALDMHVVLDGHDRLRAAALEGVRPPAITLWQPVDMPLEENVPWREEVVRNYERAFESEARLSVGSRQRLNRSLVNAFRSWRRVKTSATARPEAMAEWALEVRSAVADERVMQKMTSAP